MEIANVDPSKLLEAAIEFCWQSGFDIRDIVTVAYQKNTDIIVNGQRSQRGLTESRLDIVRLAASLSDDIQGGVRR
jgi:hypothetical protein